jgi:mycofactocin precursor
MNNEPTDHAGAETAELATDPTAGEVVETVVDEQLIEEISIDGMCGVY